MAFEYKKDESDDKAGYNQAANITQFIGQLIGSYLIYMNECDFPKVINVIERLVDLVSSHLKEPETDIINNKINELEIRMPKATVKNNQDGRVYITFPNEYFKMQKDLRDLFRSVYKLLDKYGYGMVKKDDPRLAVLKR